MASVIEQQHAATAAGWGGHSMSAPLRRVIVRQPATPQSDSQWQDFAYEHPIDIARTAAEHAALRALLADAGVEVIAAGPDPDGLLDAMFAFDSSIMSDAGAIILRSGKDLRLPEADVAAQTYAELGIPIAGRITAPGTVDGGDTLWLDPHTLAVGRSYRTNDEGIAQLRAILEPQGVQVLTVDLPHWRGPGECLHLMSFISPVAEKLAVVHLPMMPAPFVRELQARGWEFIEIAEDEFLSHGCNVLALAPRKVLVCDGSPVTRGRLEAAGCEVLVYQGDELSHNRAGGPTCLTRPILRDMAGTA
ncbi:MAG: arginine deiminase [Thermomicrobiales bacterium]|nr:arginine deiminase [Thermomicrobiales bacterium]